MNNYKLTKTILVLLLLTLFVLPGFTLIEGLHAFETTQRDTSLKRDVSMPIDRTDYAWEDLAEDGMVEVLIFLGEKADTRSTSYRIKEKAGTTKDDLAIAVVESLQKHADRTQAPLLNYLEDNKNRGKVKEFESYFIINVVHAVIDINMVSEIEARPEVDSVRPNERIDLINPIDEEGKAAQSGSVEWNVTQVKAPEVWDQGIDGSGVVVGIIDTGVDFSHEALLKKYRGYDSEGNHDHAYNWFDAYHDHYEDDRLEPDDEHSHGTHCIGSVLGADPEGENIIGVAPGAQWIAVRGLDDRDEGRGTHDKLIASAQFLLAPTENHDGTGNQDPTRAPDIINNSWGGVSGLDEWYLDIVNAWRDAGIVPVFAAGNSGPGYGTIGVPANYPNSFAVAATDENDNLAWFSSRGAAPYIHPDSMQPNISAPGVKVRSALPGDSYGEKSGTSMAAPHISGVAALLIQAEPELTVEEIEYMIMNSAVPLTDNIYPESPNYGYGYGLVNAQAALDGSKTAPAVPNKPAFPPPLDDAAFAWVNSTGEPLIPIGSTTLDISTGKLGVIKPSNDLFVYAGELFGDTWYVYAYQFSNKSLDIFKINIESGEYLALGLSGLPNNRNILGLAYDPVDKILFATVEEWEYNNSLGEWEFEANYLYTIDPETGIATELGLITNVNDVLFGIAFNQDGELYGGEMTFNESEHSYLYTINKSSGVATQIGSFGFDSWYDHQDLAFDHNNGRLYGVLFNYKEETNGLYEISASTGEASLVQDLDVYASGFAIPFESADTPTWSNMTGETALALALDKGNLAASFEGLGLGHYYDGEWNILTEAVPRVLAYDNGVIAVSVEDYGIWLYDVSSQGWQNLATVSAEALAFDDGILVASIDGYGIWYYDGVWKQLTPLTAQDIALDSGLLAVSVDGYGVWLYDFFIEDWTMLTTATALALAFEHEKLVASVEGSGTWLYLGDSWMNLTLVTAERLVFDSGKLAVSIEGYGIWLYNDSTGTWYNLAPVAAQALDFDDGILAASISGQGVWLYVK